ncbi:hypothetical protein H0H87_001917, partial [Tephrocybe sp. NHM501043]
MSTSTIVTDEPTILFHNIRDEELAQAVPLDSILTDEEFNAFMLSVSPRSTEFNLQNDFEFPCVSLDTPYFADLMSSDTTPHQFVAKCGFNASTFVALADIVAAQGERA